MTAIAGILQLDSGRPDRAAVERMEALLTPHGPDAQNAIYLPTGALLRTLRRIVPEDSLDNQPMLHQASGSYGLFDGRLDNRDELCTALGIPSQEAAFMSDSAMAFRACMHWDTDTPAHLLGDFAIACWSPRRKRLWLARDPMGTRPLFWHKKKSFFAFATTPKALFAIPGIQREICEERMADFLALLPMHGPESLYKDVFRIEPGQLLLLDDDRVSTRHFHRFDPERRLVLSSDEEYVEAFREQLTRAVHSRLRSSGPIASHLSSGFDSSTVTALAARELTRRNRRLIAYTAVPRKGFEGAVPRDRHADESPGARALAARHDNIDHVLIDPAGVTPLDNLQSNIETGDQPPRNPCNMVWINGILKDAASRGVKVLLTGGIGNMTISHSGVQLLPTLLRRGRFASWWREARAYRRLHPPHRWRTTMSASIGPLLPSPLWAIATSLFANHHYELADYTAIRAEFAARMKCSVRARSAGWDLTYKPWGDSRRMRIAVLNRVDMGEQHSSANASAGLEIRDPTSDVRLAEFCLAVPDDQYLRGGKDRWLLRRAAQDLLPTEILDTQTKGLQAADWYEGTTAALPQIQIELDRMIAHGGVGQYLDLKSLKRSLDHWPSARWNSIESVQTYRLKLLRGVSVGMFIRHIDENNE